MNPPGGAFSFSTQHRKARPGMKGKSTYGKNLKRKVVKQKKKATAMKKPAARKKARRTS